MSTPDDSTHDLVPPMPDDIGPDSIHVKPLETRFQLKVDRDLMIIGVVIMIIILICGFVIFSI